MKASGACLAGVYAAAGGLLGKFSGYQLSSHYLVSYFGQALFFFLMITLNSASLTLYIKALQGDSSFKTTITVSSVNFFLSGVFGVLCFAEVTGFLWWLGIFCVLLGIVLINSADGTSSSLKEQ